MTPEAANLPVGKASSPARKWSLWNSASFGLAFSAVSIVQQILTDRGGFELANYAQTASTATIGALAGEIAAAPLIFAFTALLRNSASRNRPPSLTNPIRGALVFIALLSMTVVGLKIHANNVFSSTSPVSGEAKKNFIKGASQSCFVTQRKYPQNTALSDTQIDNYCKCVSEKVADNTAYRELATDPDNNALIRLRQKTEIASQACLGK